jgi:hypothetical protein
MHQFTQSLCLYQRRQSWWIAAVAGSRVKLQSCISNQIGTQTSWEFLQMLRMYKSLTCKPRGVVFFLRYRTLQNSLSLIEQRLNQMIQCERFVLAPRR